MQEMVQHAVQMIDLQLWHILYLIFVGFVGGLVSGFIGSGGAFVLTPSMMSMGGSRDCGCGLQYVSQVLQGPCGSHQKG